MTWYRLKVPTDTYLPAALRVMKFFVQQYLHHQMPEGAALLISDTPNRMDPFIGQNWFYFTPVAAQMCKQMLVTEGGEPCSEPSFEESSYLAGDEAYLDEQRRSRSLDTSAGTD